MEGEPLYSIRDLRENVVEYNEGRNRNYSREDKIASIVGEAAQSDTKLFQ